MWTRWPPTLSIVKSWTSAAPASFKVSRTGEPAVTASDGGLNRIWSEPFTVIVCGPPPPAGLLAAPLAPPLHAVSASAAASSALKPGHRSMGIPLLPVAVPVVGLRTSLTVPFSADGALTFRPDRIDSIGLPCPRAAERAAAPRSVPPARPLARRAARPPGCAAGRELQSTGDAAHEALARRLVVPGAAPQVRARTLSLGTAGRAARHAGARRLQLRGSREHVRLQRRRCARRGRAL